MIYQKLRIQVLLVITVGYGFVYTCRLVLSVVKKPLIDSGIFSAQDLGIIGSAIFYSYAFGKLMVALEAVFVAGDDFWRFLAF